MTENDQENSDAADAVEGRDSLHRINRTVRRDSRRAFLRVALIIALVALAWTLILLHLGLWRASIRPAQGLLSYTFAGWEQFPPSRHAFMAQYDGTEFARHVAYTSFPYPFLLAMFVVVAPVHYLFDVPYSLAHNIVPYVFVAGLILLLLVSAWSSLRDASERPALARSLLVFLGVGIVVTNALPWVALLKYNRDTYHVVAAACFCYLSTFLYRDDEPRRALLIVGIVLALWSPIFMPAWVLSNFVFSATPELTRRRFTQIVAVCALALLNLVLPVLVCRLAGIDGRGATVFYRSGLDGSTRYMSGIIEAVVSPVDPRHWPLLLPLLVTMLSAVALHFALRGSGCRPLQQAAFLLLPYATIAILLPQYTSIHPYATDMLLLVPSAFLLGFWLLQKELWNRLTGRLYAVCLLIAVLVLMSNLLTVAQSFAP